MSTHLSALAHAGYVEVACVRADSRSRRQVTLTRSGRVALRGHLAALQALAAAAGPAPPQKRSRASAAKGRKVRRDVALDPRAA